MAQVFIRPPLPAIFAIYTMFEDCRVKQQVTMARCRDDRTQSNGNNNNNNNNDYWWW